MARPLPDEGRGRYYSKHNYLNGIDSKLCSGNVWRGCEWKCLGLKLVRARVAQIDVPDFAGRVQHDSCGYRQDAKVADQSRMLGGGKVEDRHLILYSCAQLFHRRQL